MAERKAQSIGERRVANSPIHSYRWSGLAAILGGGMLLFTVISVPLLVSLATPATLLVLVPVLSVLRYRGTTLRWLGRNGLLLASVGGGLTVVGGVLAILGLTLGVLLFVVGFFFGLHGGLFLFGIEARRKMVFPRWNVLPLIIGGLFVLSGILLLINPASLRGGLFTVTMFFGSFGWVILGYGLWSGTENQTPRGGTALVDESFDNETTGTDGVADVHLAIESPASGTDLIGPTEGVEVHIFGTARAERFSSGQLQSRPVDNVEVSFNEGEYQLANSEHLSDHTAWSFTATIQDPDPHLTITTAARAGGVDESETITVSVTVDNEFEDLTITAPRTDEEKKIEGPPYEVTVEGEASDVHGIKWVKCGLEDSLELAEDVSNEEEGWYKWNQDVTLPEEGTYTIIVRAEDTSGNTAEQAVTVTAVDVFEPELTIHGPDPIVKSWPEDGQLTVTVTGETKDIGSGVETVKWIRDDEKSGNVNPSEEGWSKWSTGPIEIPDPNSHEIVIRAWDRAGNTVEKKRTVYVFNPRNLS